jgi:hypothetical protein
MVNHDPDFNCFLIYPYCQFRRILSDRNLWNPKEEQAWVHDRYDEMHPRGYHNGNVSSRIGEYSALSSMHVLLRSCFFFCLFCFQIRNPRGRSRGRGNLPGGRTRGGSRGNFRGNRSRAHDDNQNYSYVPKGTHVASDNMKNPRPDPHANGKNRASKPSHSHNDDVDSLNMVPKESRTYNDNSRSNKDTPRVSRGRGSKRYQPRSRSTTEISSEQNNRWVEGFLLMQP